MVAIMDMRTGERLSDAELYGEEVLNAGWLPQAALQLGLQSAVSPARKLRSKAVADPDTFLRRLYSAQE